jgi:hypothetical protein
LALPVNELVDCKKRGSSGKWIGGCKKIYEIPPMHEIGNPLFSNPVKLFTLFIKAGS